MVRAEFQKKDLESLVESNKRLVYDILRSINEGSKGQEIDVECLLELLEGFCGRDYIVHMKLENDFPLSQEDKDYLKEMLNKRMS